jgi:hypothetical protein
MLFGLLLAASFCQVPAGLNTPINYDETAKLVPAVLTELTKQSNVQLTATSEAAKEVLLITVKDLPLKSLMDKVAFVTSCRWESKGAGHTLVPDTTVRAKEENEEAQARTEWVRKAISAKLKQSDNDRNTVSKNSSTGEILTDQNRYDQFGMGTLDDDRAITRLLTMINPGQMAAVLQGNRVVWATNNPTDEQIPLTGDASAIITEWKANHDMVSSVAHVSSGLTPDAESDNSATPNTAPLRTPLDENGTPVPVQSAPIAKALLVAEPVPEKVGCGGIQLKLKAYGADGSLMLAGEDVIGVAPVQKNGSTKPNLNPSDLKSETPIEYSETTKQVRECFHNPNKPVQPELKDKLLNPDKFDPLSFEESDIYRGVAKLLNRQLVADLPDKGTEENSIQDASVEPPTTVQNAIALIRRRVSLQSVDDGQFLYLKPSKPVRARLNRVDRPALHRLLEISATKRTFGLDEIAEYATVNEDLGHNGSAEQYVAYFFPGSWSGFSDTRIWSLYRFYGTLDPDQRQILQSEGSLPFTGLGENQQTIFRTYLFGPSCCLVDANAVIAQLRGTGKIVILTAPQGLVDFQFAEPTQVMPNGLPVGGSVSAKVEKEPVVLCSSSRWPFESGVLGPDELALRQWSFPGGEGPLKLPKEGFLGVRQKLFLTLHVAKDYSASEVLQDRQVDRDAYTVQLNALPSEFQARVTAALLGLKKILGGTNFSIGEAKPIPKP